MDEQLDVTKDMYLVSKTEYFFDGHGCEDEGSTEYFLTNSDRYSRLGDGYYDSWIYQDPSDLKPYSDDSLQAQDGYNCTACTYMSKKVGEVDANWIRHILQEYKLIAGLFNER